MVSVFYIARYIVPLAPPLLASTAITILTLYRLNRASRGARRGRGRRVGRPGGTRQGPLMSMFRRPSKPPRPALEFPSGWDDWDRRRLVTEQHFVPWVDRVLALEGRTILEYGCGNGPITAAFAPHAERYIGIDIDGPAVDVTRRLLGEAGLQPELHVAPPEEILDRTAAFRGEIDIFLCAAVLEHMSGTERLALLRLAREVVRPEGIIVVVETPNRLTPWDYHTSLLPFVFQLPEELALAYVDRSPRKEFVDAMQAAAANGEDAHREAWIRWGRGMSFHEFELVFENLPSHIVASSWDPILLGEREVHREELALQRVLDTARPDLPAAFSRYWLDFILAATPREAPGRFLRPWALHTHGSHGAAYGRDQNVHLDGEAAVLAVDLPTESARLVVGSERLAAPLGVEVRQAGLKHRRAATLAPARRPTRSSPSRPRLPHTRSGWTAREPSRSCSTRADAAAASARPVARAGTR